MKYSSSNELSVNCQIYSDSTIDLLAGDGVSNRHKTFEVPIHSRKRSSLDVNFRIGPALRLKPGIRSEQVANDVVSVATGGHNEAPKLLLSSPTPEKDLQDVVPNHPEPLKTRTKSWRSQTAFELSPSMSCESEANFIINEFLHKTSVNEGITSSSNVGAPKMESYV